MGTAHKVHCENLLGSHEGRASIEDPAFIGLDYRPTAGEIAASRERRHRRARRGHGRGDVLAVDGGDARGAARAAVGARDLPHLRAHKA